MKDSPDEKQDRPDDEHTIEIEVEDHNSSADSDAGAGESGSGREDSGTAEVEGTQSPDRETKAGEKRNELVDELRARAEEYLDHLQRLKAEFENFRKRMQREREESWKRARGDLLLDVIPFLDDMQRLIETPVNERDTASLIEGMKLIEKGMMDHLEKEGLERIEAEGSRFDPNLHEAVELQVVDDREKDGLVAEELTRGFLYKGTLLRPARVKVYKYIEAREEKE